MILIKLGKNIYYGLVVALTLIAYFRSLDYFFLNDDFLWLETAILSKDNPIHLMDLSRYHEFRPVVNLYFLVVHTVFGLNPTGFHLTNLIIHIMNSMMVVYLATSLAPSEKVGGLAGVLFSVNFAHSGTVEWVSAASALLGTFFYLIAFISIRYYLENGERRFYLASILSFLAALFSVEYTITLPVLMAVYVLLKYQKKDLKVLLPFFIIACFFVLFQFGLQTSYNPGNSKTYYRHEGIISPDYFIDNLVQEWQMLWLPFKNDLWKNKVLTPEMEAALLITLFIIIGSFYLIFKGDRHVKFSVAWIYITFLPFMLLSSQIFQRYLYLPSIGYSMILAGLIFVAYKKLDIRFGTAFSGLLTLLIIANLFVHIWYINTDGADLYRGREVESTISGVMELYPEFPPDSTVVIIDPPMMFEYTSAMFRVFYRSDISVLTYIHEEVGTTLQSNPDDDYFVFRVTKDGHVTEIR